MKILLFFILVLILLCASCRRTEHFRNLRQYSDAIRRIQSHFAKDHKEVIYAQIISSDTIDVNVFDTKRFVSATHRVRVDLDKLSVSPGILSVPKKTIKHQTFF